VHWLFSGAWWLRKSLTLMLPKNDEAEGKMLVNSA